MYSNRSLAKLSDLTSTVAEIYISTHLENIKSSVEITAMALLITFSSKDKMILDFLAGWKK